ncbi:DUF4232 domain-containing protein [Streptomyces qinzhouensis]|uniref:DUF4232 domain-containing protein n=1 Tax=Streptomyces qinzhouensis TaxID=2599401 RepID=A0A5B8J7T0_9ACTN|nr:DUF4232 domain-containing protein [Streptomyces qinzhouensis]QDY77296.1 DUF4232 domain-containing protein [Streptomyces qinzhouensis]
MRSASQLPSVAVLFAGALFLTACGTGPGGGEAKCREAGPPVGAAKDGVRITGTTGLGPAGPGCDSAVPSVAFEVANPKKEAYAYIVTFSVTDHAGKAYESGPVTVDSVAGGSTGRSSFTPTPAQAPSDSAGAAGVKILKVRSVPVAEVGAPAGACPRSGVRVTTNEGEAAMGLRAVGVRLENCGTQPYELDGYPRVTPLDEKHRPLKGIRTLRGGGEISTGLGTASPRRFSLAPGEVARTSLMWRNTHTGFGEAANGPYVRLVAKPGASPVMLIPELDLGTTGKLGVSAWEKERG